MFEIPLVARTKGYVMSDQQIMHVFLKVYEMLYHSPKVTAGLNSANVRAICSETDNRCMQIQSGHTVKDTPV